LAQIAFEEINREVLEPLRPPITLYYVVVALLASGIVWAAVCWMYQIRQGMGVAGLNHPVGWGVYITNFVFWVGIAHSGTLISAILYLVRSRWRTAVARSAEAMTVFAVITAGLFPLVHLGRVWVVYYILPYPSERQLWPNFMSPLVWDVLAVSTYLTVSVIFFYVGLIPDLAAARDRSERLLGNNHPRTMFYRILSLGWTGSSINWRHHGRAYLFFAALATPLVISVHSVVSWDFAMSNLPGWHTTIFAPYFVAGAIDSGLAMVLILLIPMRRFFNLDRLITIDHFEMVAKTMIVTTLVVGYAYILEPFISWYSGDLFEKQFAFWRATGFLAVFFWALTALNVLAPIAFLFRKVRRNLYSLFIIGLLVITGMWLERYVIIIGSLAHDFLPHNWDMYRPTWVEISITAGSFTFFFFWFFLFSKLFPTVGISDVKEIQTVEPCNRADIEPPSQLQVIRPKPLSNIGTGLLAVYSAQENLVKALGELGKTTFQKVEMYSPLRLREAECAMGIGPSPVRYWTLIGALSGMTGGFALAILAAQVNNLVVGAKLPVSLIPYCIPGFEGTILFGVIFNLIGTVIHSRFGKSNVPRWYDRRFSNDRYGLYIECAPEETEIVRQILASSSPEEIRDVR
jgi:Ni/Fe-hydrogenase subunit HybB-like protein